MGKRKKTGQAISLAAHIFFFGVIIMVLLVRYAFVEHKPTFPPLPESFDLIVIGDGPAGDLAAIVAAEKGAHVLYMHTSEPEADTPGVYLPVFWAADTGYQRVAGIEYLPETMANEIYTSGESSGSYRQILAFSLASAESLRYLTELTGQQFLRLDPERPGLHWGEQESMIKISSRLAGQVEALDLIEKTGLQPQSLVTENSRVVGLTAVDPTGREEIIYTRAVILADGGYGSNQELLQKYSGLQGIMKRPEAGHLGVGLQLAQKIGARTISLEQVQVETIAIGTKRYLELSPEILAAAFIFGEKGRPLTWEENESLTELLKQNGGRVYLLFTTDYPELIPFKPTVVEDLELLASALQTTVFELEEHLAGAPPPYYLLSAGLVALTPGGLAVNENYQVLGVVEPISGLYACGELTEGLHGRAAISELFFTETIVSSRLAGENAAAYALR